MTGPSASPSVLASMMTLNGIVLACSCYSWMVHFLECSDYGYMRSDGFTGPCIRDNSIDISPTSCTNESLTYSESQGYRKVAGDVCAGGVEFALGPVTRPCCIGTVVDGKFWPPLGTSVSVHIIWTLNQLVKGASCNYMKQPLLSSCTCLQILVTRNAFLECPHVCLLALAMVVNVCQDTARLLPNHSLHVWVSAWICLHRTLGSLPNGSHPQVLPPHY